MSNWPTTTDKTTLALYEAEEHLIKAVKAVSDLMGVQHETTKALRDIWFEFMNYCMNPDEFIKPGCVRCASCGAELRLNTEDLNNTQCMKCYKEAK